MSHIIKNSLAAQHSTNIIQQTEIMTVVGKISSHTLWNGSHMKKNTLIAALILIIQIYLLTACGTNSIDAAAAVEGYHQALVIGNRDQLIGYSCSAWEATAQDEIASFTALEVTLENIACEVMEEHNDTSLVVCTGMIHANYGNEVLDIDLSAKAYEVIQEGGEWRLCGYR
jgi:hypothetical protein